jgi:hypothetical protein
VKSAYRGIAYLIALGVVAQAAFIALAWFSVINDMESGAVFTKDSDWNAGHMLHMMVGMLAIPVLSLLLVLTSFLTKVKGASKLAGMVFGAVVLQVALGIFAFSLPAVGALHGINAFALLAVAILAGRRMSAAMTQPAAASADGVAVPAQGSAPSAAPTSTSV